MKQVLLLTFLFLLSVQAGRRLRNENAGEEKANRKRDIDPSLVWFNQTLQYKADSLQSEYCFPISIRPRGVYETTFVIHFAKAGDRAIIESDVDFTKAVETYDKPSSTVTFTWKFSSAHTFPSNVFIGKVIGAKIVGLTLNIYSDYGFDIKDAGDAICPTDVPKANDLPLMDLKPAPVLPLDLKPGQEVSNNPDALGPTPGNIEAPVVPLPVPIPALDSNGNSGVKPINSEGSNVIQPLDSDDMNSESGVIAGGSDDIIGLDSFDRCQDCDERPRQAMAIFNEVVLMILLPLLVVLLLAVCCALCCRRARKQQRDIETHKSELESLKDHHPGSFFAPSQMQPVFTPGQGIQYVILPPAPWMQPGQQQPQQFFVPPPFAFPPPLPRPNQENM